MELPVASRWQQRRSIAGANSAETGTCNPHSGSISSPCAKISRPRSHLPAGMNRLVMRERQRRELMPIFGGVPRFSGVIYLVQIEWHTEPLSAKLIHLAHARGAARETRPPIHRGYMPLQGQARGGQIFAPKCPQRAAPGCARGDEGPVGVQHPPRLRGAPQYPP